ncbi:MAG: orotidine-5'-phosphate decarboxylase [Ezakiella sp.]|nr:orotidine-5'-phosphate decarboxylase [Ezakiella sp.]
MSIDRLYKRVSEVGPICVGLDPNLSHMPAFTSSLNVEEAIFKYNKAIIDSTKDLVAVYKPQAAYYESAGLDGLKAYKRTLEYLRSNDCLIINDVKRSDISSTAAAYAKAYFSGDYEGDFLTLNPYMGLDSIEPYMEYVEKHNKGLFVIIKTSNPGSKDFEELMVEDMPLYNHIADRIREMDGNSVGTSGYRKIGYVIGATSKESGEGSRIRDRYGDVFFLVPGYGAQGGGREDALELLNDRNGGVINSSRGIIRAFESSDEDFETATRKAVLKMVEDFR